MNLNLYRVQHLFKTNKDAAEYLKKLLDTKYPWLEWVVIAYNNKNGQVDESAAYFEINERREEGRASRGK